MGDALPAVDLGDNTVQEVAAGQSHTCVLFTSGNVACWGYNEYGQARGVEVSSIFGACAVRVFILFFVDCPAGQLIYGTVIFMD